MTDAILPLVFDNRIQDMIDWASIQVSSGALDMAKSNLEAMLIQCAKTPEGDASTEDFLAVQKKSLHDVIHELVRQVTSPNTLVREQVRL